MRGFSYVEGVLGVDGLALDRAIAEVGTPAYVYALDDIAFRAARLKTLFGQVWYSVKANANVDVLRTLSPIVDGFDVVSGGELLRVLSAGIDASRISFAGVGKTAEELDLAVKHGVLVHVESVEEVSRLHEVAVALDVRVRVGLRVNPGVSIDTLAGMQTGASRAKFGLSVPDCHGILERAADFTMFDLVGVHMHVGSQISQTSEMVKAARVILGVLSYGRSLGLPLRRFDVGGGFPLGYGVRSVPDPADFAAALHELVDGLDVDLVVEPGRWLVGESGVLVTSVLYRKETVNGRMLIVDTGMHHFIRPALYGASHEILPVRPDGPTVGPADVVGPICESTDHFATVELPALGSGDLLAIMDTGAYGMVMASNYNVQVRPPEIVISGGRARVSRPRERYEDIL